MTLADVVAVILFLGVTAYAVFGGADFGSGFWDLTAGRAAHGARLRALVDVAIGPVWEANHVWLIFCLVVLWTAFPVAFASIMSTLFIPLTLAAFGIVLRGAGFAFRKVAHDFRSRRLFGIVFASSSVITPFFMGTVAGAIASGRVPVGNAAGQRISSWVNPTSLLGGILAVAVCAFLAAVFLVHDADREGADDLAEACRRRAVLAGVACGVIATGGLFVIRSDAPLLWDGLTGKALPLLVVSGLGGVGAMVLASKGHAALARLAAAGAVAVVVWGWGLAQYPYVLPDSLTIEQAAAPEATLVSVLVVFGLACLIVVPSLILLYRLDQTAELEPDELAVIADENRPATAG